MGTLSPPLAFSLFSTLILSPSLLSPQFPAPAPGCAPALFLPGSPLPSPLLHPSLLPPASPRGTSLPIPCPPHPHPRSPRLEGGGEMTPFWFHPLLPRCSVLLVATDGFYSAIEAWRAWITQGPWLFLMPWAWKINIPPLPPAARDRPTPPPDSLLLPPFIQSPQT